MDGGSASPTGGDRFSLVDGDRGLGAQGAADFEVLAMVKVGTIVEVDAMVEPAGAMVEVGSMLSSYGSRLLSSEI